MESVRRALRVHAAFSLLFALGACAGDIADPEEAAPGESATPYDDVHALAAPEEAEIEALPDGLAEAQKPFVSIPAGYKYDPKLGHSHDYCTSSPDEFPAPAAKNADFRGPCARHDICYDSHVDKKKCDNNLRNDMRTNCAYQYGTFNPLRGLCYDTANAYWVAVVAAS